MITKVRRQGIRPTFRRAWPNAWVASRCRLTGWWVVGITPRVDFRMKPNGKPYVLEVNPNPEISTDAGFAGCLGSATVTYKEFIIRLVRHAMNRPKGPVPNFAMNRCLSLQPVN